MNSVNIQLKAKVADKTVIFVLPLVVVVGVVVVVGGVVVVVIVTVAGLGAIYV